VVFSCGDNVATFSPYTRKTVVPAIGRNDFPRRREPMLSAIRR
jgi:hypothetical protein